MSALHTNRWQHCAAERETSAYSFSGSGKGGTIRIPGGGGGLEFF